MCREVLDIYLGLGPFLVKAFKAPESTAGIDQSNKVRKRGHFLKQAGLTPGKALKQLFVAHNKKQLELQVPNRQILLTFL